MPIMKPTEDYQKREFSIYRRNRLGPIHVVRSEQHVTATAPNGYSVELFSSWVGDRKLICDTYAAGVPIITNGTPTGTLIQHRHGVLQKNRTLDIIGDTPDRYPPGAFFRARGIGGDLSLETPGHKIITPRHPRVLTFGRFLRLGDDATAELLTLYTAVKTAAIVVVLS